MIWFNYLPWAVGCCVFIGTLCMCVWLVDFEMCEENFFSCRTIYRRKLYKNDHHGISKTAYIKEYKYQLEKYQVRGNSLWLEFLDCGSFTFSLKLVMFDNKLTV